MPKLAENRVMIARRISFILKLLIFCAATLALVASCAGTKDLVLEDPTFRDDMVNRALDGKRFKITPEDYPEIRLLMTEGNPDYRLAGVILAIQADDSALYSDIVTAALDENPEVSDLARTHIGDNPEDFRPLIMNLLEEDDPSSRVGGLLLLAELGGDDLIALLISFFNDPDPLVRNQASLSVRSLTDRNDPVLRAALRDPDPLTASMAYRTLGRYGNPDDAPVFVSAFSSGSPEVRREAQLATLRLGDAGLPFLHIEASDTGGSYAVRLSALEVIQGLRSTGSLTLLMVLLEDPDERISRKAETILGTYGAEAIPALAKLYKESGEANRIHAVRLMGEIGSSSAFPTLASALDDPSPVVREVASESLLRFGDIAWPAIRGRIANGGPVARDAAITLLRDQSDPWLVSNEDGSPNLLALLLLITSTESSELSAYLQRAGISRLKTESIESLKDAWDIAEDFAELEGLIASGDDPYLYAWRQREIFSVAAREALAQSFDELHEYFDTRDLQALEKSKASRAESQKLENEARKQKALIDGMSDEIKTGGEVRLSQYREIRNLLVRTWEYVIPELKPLAEAVYADRGLNPDFLVRESALLD